jgi:hypothetical protein
MPVSTRIRRARLAAAAARRLNAKFIQQIAELEASLARSHANLKRTYRLLASMQARGSMGPTAASAARGRAT